MSKIAVVTGATRGIGLEVARALGVALRSSGRVYLTARDEKAGRAALEGLHLPNVVFHKLDVANEESVRAFSEHLKKTHGGLDILVNNAGYSSHDMLGEDYTECKKVIDINYRGITYTVKYLFPLLRENGRVVNVSSDCGHLSNLKHPEWISRLKSESLTLAEVDKFLEWYLESVRNGSYSAAHFEDGGHFPAYRVSKIALSAATRLWAKQCAERGISITHVHPGLVRTDMTQGSGFLTPAQAASGIVALALRPTPDYNGAYVWHDGTLVDWADHEDSRWYFRSSTLQEYA